MSTQSVAMQQKEALIERLLKSVAGTFDIFTIYIGDRLGFYQALAQDWLTSTELATQTNTIERYVREWLEQQTVTGILEVDDENAPAKTRRYHLSAGHVEALLDRDSLDYLTPLTYMLVGVTRPLTSLLNVYRNGGGVPYREYGTMFREGQAAINRSMFLQQLGTEWIPAMPDIHARLQADPPARIADIGCGGGWSSIGIAQAYPKVQVDGYDIDVPSVELAQRNVREARLSDRVTIHHHDVSNPILTQQYDLVTAFECIHDLGNPVGALQTMRRLVKNNGAVLIADERVGDRFTASGNDIEWMMYGWSVLHCLPVGMADNGEYHCGGTGTVMRTDTLRCYAQAAGFSDIEILPIDNFFFRFYRLYPS